MPIKYVPFIPEPVEGQAVLGNFNRILRYKGADDSPGKGLCHISHVYAVRSQYPQAFSQRRANPI